jgi:hypothetical protein
MGLCIDANENKQRLTFEIKRDSVVFYGDFWCSDVEDGVIDNVEMDKKLLAKIATLCKDKKWKHKIFKVVVE